MGDEAVLLDLAEEVGLTREAATECLSERTMKTHVDLQIQEARGYGITGVPNIYHWEIYGCRCTTLFGA